jgi:magnesium-transporting ATPase (P-type)
MPTSWRDISHKVTVTKVILNDRWFLSNKIETLFYCLLNNITNNNTLLIASILRYKKCPLTIAILLTSLLAFMLPRK